VQGVASTAVAHRAGGKDKVVRYEESKDSNIPNSCNTILPARQDYIHSLATFISNHPQREGFILS